MHGGGVDRGDRTENWELISPGVASLKGCRFTAISLRGRGGFSEKSDALLTDAQKRE